MKLRSVPETSHVPSKDWKFVWRPNSVALCGDSRSSSVHSPLESWAQQMLWRRNFFIQSPNISTDPLGTRDWKVLIRAESLGTSRSLDGWEGCVYVHLVDLGGAGALFTDPCVYMCCAFHQSLSYLSSPLFQQFLSVAFIGWWRESETSEATWEMEGEIDKECKRVCKRHELDAQWGESGKEEPQRREGKRKTAAHNEVERWDSSDK